jgi:hypothetical protein
VKEIIVPIYVQTELALAPIPAAESKLLFAGMSDDELLGYGVPAEWLNDVKAATYENAAGLDRPPPCRGFGSTPGVGDRRQASRPPDCRGYGEPV